jgi:hypothetical protein
MGMIVFWIVVLVAAGLFIFITLGNLKNIASPITSFGCATGKQVTTPCPCNGQTINSGYCCESGPSQIPCCADGNLKKCGDYVSKDECTQDACGLGCGKWDDTKKVCA